MQKMTQSSGTSGRYRRVEGVVGVERVRVGDRLTSVWAALAVLTLAGALFGYEAHIRLRRLERNVFLTQVLLPGRTRAEVIHWMGPPDRVLRSSPLVDGANEEVMVYLSSPRTPQGSGDVWVLLDDAQRVVSVYYPDRHKDREIVEGVVSLRPDG